MSHETTKRDLVYKVNLSDGRVLQYHRSQTKADPLVLESEIELRGKKLEVEIGSGTGRFISSRAQKYNDRYFIGIDKKKDRFDATTEKLSKTGLSNWKILRVDAKSFLEQPLPPIHILHVYHPDPWPKKSTTNIDFSVHRTLNIGAKRLKSVGSFDFPRTSLIILKKFLPSPTNGNFWNWN